MAYLQREWDGVFSYIYMLAQTSLMGKLVDVLIYAKCITTIHRTQISAGTITEVSSIKQRKGADRQWQKHWRGRIVGVWRSKAQGTSGKRVKCFEQSIPLRRMRSAWPWWRTSMVSPSITSTSLPLKSAAQTIVGMSKLPTAGMVSSAGPWSPNGGYRLPSRCASMRN